MKYLWVLAMSVCIGFCVVISLSIPLQAQMTGAPIPFSADWAYYIESERQDSGRFYATQETVRIEKGAGKAEEFISYTTIWDYRKMVAHVLEDWHQKYFSSIIQPRSAGDDFGDFGVPCPFWLGDFTATPLGSDTLQGRETETWSCSYPNGYSMIAWFDTRLQRTIRYEFEDIEEYMEMTNIKEGPQPECLFVVPPDYSRL